ncbi:DEAD/DEAH box helicase [Mycobacterium servetii]|uniref:Helicase associated domain protein n=1 Tax=Mycobacterium servetii TaxID=3237418 RepID=A0ABV4C938_9MYCO
MTTAEVITWDDRGSLSVAPSVSVALRPHQQSAFDEANGHLRSHDRVTVVMPCGTGKTLLGQRIAQHQARHGSSAILVLVPTVALLKQTLDSWVKHSRRPVAAFVFCHDTTIASSDLHVPVSTRPGALAEWLARTRRASRGPSDEQVVVFATYQSSPRIADAHRNHHLAPWHVVVADEAHCCAGEFEAAFATVVDDNRVPAAVRIFLTATPRVRKNAAQAAFCMDDPAAFGPIVAPLSVRSAIDAGLLSDYLIAVVAVTDNDVREAITAGGSPVMVGEQPLPVEQVAVQLAVAAAARTYDLRRIMVFHNSIAASRAFTDTLATIVDGRGVRAEDLVAMHLDGDTPALQRDEHLQVLAAPPDQGLAVLSNVRCLGQGIDVPALDGVVFAGPRTSQLDITQCVGRALRLDPQRADPAVVVLPVFLDAAADLHAQVASSRFRHVYRTLLALADQDTELADELSMVYRRRRGSSPNRGGGDRKVVLLDAVGGPGTDDLYNALQLRSLRLLTPNWERGYQELQAYVAEHGDARVPANYVTATGFPLGAWVRGNRHKRDRLTHEQVAKLQSENGWAWNLHEAAWWEAYERLRVYIDQHGHACIPRRYRCADGFALDQWVSVQRADIAAGRMPADREAALRALKVFSLRPSDDRFEAGLVALSKYAATYGHACPPQNYVNPADFALGHWTKNVRRRYAQLTAEQRAAVEAQPGWVWDVREANWQRGLAELVAYEAAHGHLRVARDYVTASGEPLGKWFDNQKTARRAGMLAPHRARALTDRFGPKWFHFPSTPAAGLKGAPSDPTRICSPDGAVHA